MACVNDPGVTGGTTIQRCHASKRASTVVASVRAALASLVAAALVLIGAPASAGSSFASPADDSTPSLRVAGVDRTATSLSSSGPLYGGFEGEMLCDRGFENEGVSEYLSGPCWHNAPGYEWTGTPRFSTSAPASGARSLELCGYALCREAILQPITVPYGITSAVLSADMKHVAADATYNDCSSGDDYTNSDYVVSSVVGHYDTSQGAVTAINLCEGGAAGWRHVEADVTDALRQIEGHETSFYVYAETSPGDAGERFFVDNVSLVVSATGKEMTTFPRDVSLKLARHLKATGRITSSDPGMWPACSSQAVKVQRKFRTGWATLTTATIGSNGYYSVTLTDRAGQYRAVVPRKQLDVAHRCAKAVSPVRTHAH